jgi:predicted amidohydrolase
MTIRAAAMQIASVPGDRAATLEKACTWIDRAAEQKIELLVFPEWYHPGIELFVLAKNPENRYEHFMDEFKAQLDTIPGPTTDRISEKAREHGMHIVYGIIALLPGGQMANTSALFGPDGDILNVHRKTVLTPGLETPELTKGDELNVISTALGEIGQLICADASLPESPRVLAIKGAEIICHSMGSFYVDDPDKRYVVRDITLRSHCSPSRAIDNNVFIVVANLVGVHGGMEFYGKSRIMNPRGDIIAEGQEDISSEELVIADIDLAERKEGNTPFRLIDRRRPEIYGDILNPNPVSGGLVWHDPARGEQPEEAAE